MHTIQTVLRVQCWNLYRTILAFCKQRCLKLTHFRQCEEHTATCKKWAEEKVVMFTQEREVLVGERKRLERAQQRLSDERDLLQQRVKRLDSLMERVKT